MSQNAVVKRIVKDGVVEVSLLRQMECGLSCNGSCESCGMKPKEELLALAQDGLESKVGDVVEVESTAGGAIGISLLVFLFPCAALVAGYLFGQYALHLSETASLLPALVGLLLGFLPSWFYNRAVTRKKGLGFIVLRKLT